MSRNPPSCWTPNRCRYANDMLMKSCLSLVWVDDLWGGTSGLWSSQSAFDRLLLMLIWLSFVSWVPTQHASVLRTNSELNRRLLCGERCKTKEWSGVCSVFSQKSMVLQSFDGFGFDLCVKRNNSVTINTPHRSARRIIFL